MKIKEHLESALNEVLELDRRLDEWANDPNRAPLGQDEVAIGSVLGNRLTTPAGAEHFRRATELLLQHEKLQTRISVETAYRCLDKELQVEIERSRKDGRWSLNAAIQRARRQLRQAVTFSGHCLFPAHIAARPARTDLRFGPVRVMCKSVFEEEFHPTIKPDFPIDEDVKSQPNNESRLLKRWGEYSKDYPFIVSVKIEGFELEMARPIARQAAEFVLNQLRLALEHRQAGAIRLSGDSKPDTHTSFLAISDGGETCGSYTMRGEGTSLPDDWPEELIQHVGAAKPMIDAIAERLVRGDPFTEPVVERIRYADQLFTEAMQDRSPRMALVKVVSALEALCVLPKAGKAKELELRCALACSFDDLEYYRKVKEAVGRAYEVRNRVVHGDAPDAIDAAMAMRGLRLYLYPVVVHLWSILIHIQNEHKPQSVRPLRRHMASVFEEREKLLHPD